METSTMKFNTNKMDLNNRKMKNHPPPIVRVSTPLTVPCTLARQPTS